MKDATAGPCIGIPIESGWNVPAMRAQLVNAIAVLVQRGIVDEMPADPETCEHVWTLDKTSTVVKLVCLKCGAIKDYSGEHPPSHPTVELAKATLAAPVSPSNFQL